MNCQEFWKNPSGTQMGRVHLDTCPVCAARWARHGEVAAGLRRLAEESCHIEAPSRVESRLLAAFRGHVGLGMARPRSRWIPIVTWGSAAAALALVALLLVQPRPPLPARRSDPNPVQLAALDVPQDAPGPDASGFISLPNAAQIEENEEVNLVRVELPRSAMLALGLEVDADRAEEAVSADVMLGHDGLARAVRFLED